MAVSKAAAVKDKGKLADRFHLVRFFSITALLMFAVVAVGLIYFEYQQAEFFHDVQAEQNQNFQQVQEDFSELQARVARRDLLAIHEAGNVNLTRLFANALWESDFAPFVAKASQIPVQHCRAIPDVEVDGSMQAPPEKQACFDAVGEQIMAIDGFAAINDRVFQSMDSSSVLKIKVFDVRGVTVYSSDHSQIGDDKIDNAGFLQARQGTPASTLSHRGRFDAFEGTLSERDVISSYLPVYKPGTTEIVGVFEVYSDVTRFLATINATSDQIGWVATNNQAQVEEVARLNEAQVEQSSTTTVAIILGILALLFGGLFLIVRKADTILVQQAKDKEHAQQQLAQAEKMASLGQMVAGVAHQLNTPIAFSHNNVAMVKEGLKELSGSVKLAKQFATLSRSAGKDKVTVNVARSRPLIDEVAESETDTLMLREMLDDTSQGLDQMRELVENLRDFTRLDRSKVVLFDLNKGLKNVVYIARTVISKEIEIIEDYGDLPQVMCNPSQLNQVFLNLVTNAAHAIEGAGTIVVRSRAEGDKVIVEVEDNGTGIEEVHAGHIFENYYSTKPEDQGTGLGLPIARSIVEEYGGKLEFVTEVGQGSTFSVIIPKDMDSAKAT